MPELETRPSAAQRLARLRESLLKDSAFSDVVGLSKPDRRPRWTVSGDRPARWWRLPWRSAVRPAPVVVVAAKSTEIDDLVDGLRLFSPRRVAIYPALEERPNKLLEDENYGERLRTLKDLVQDEPPGFVVTSIASLLQPVPDRATLEANTRRIRVGGIRWTRKS